jgi:hypothetical protein
MKARKIFIVPADEPTQAPPKKVTAAEIDETMKRYEREQKQLQDFLRKKPK